MNILDKLFGIIFARYRRKLGDSKIESAWYQASNKVVAYIGSPILAVEFLIFAIIYFPLVKGSVFDNKRSIVIMGTTIFLVVAYSLGRGFRAFLADPPVLTSTEAPAETRFVFWIRIISFGMSGAACLVAFTLHKAGFPVIR